MAWNESQLSKDGQASYNFQIAKILAVVLIASAHYFPNTILWVPSTISLFLFGFASAYYTHRKYREHFELLTYWSNKVGRLGYRLIVINTFLLILCLVFSKQDLWVWQTPVNMLGLTGLLLWFGIENPSPLGRGLWFFTVLIFFYCSYPLLRHLNYHKLTSFAAVLLLFLGTSYLHYHVIVGYDLWLTIFSFLFGVFIAQQNLRLPSSMSAFIMCTSAFGMIGTNLLWNITIYNYVFIVTCSIGIVFWLMEFRLSPRLLRPITYFSDCTFEIYLLHTYLFVEITGSKAFNYVFSLCLILIFAKLLQQLTEMLRTWFTKSFWFKKALAYIGNQQ